MTCSLSLCFFRLLTGWLDLQPTIVKLSLPIQTLLPLKVIELNFFYLMSKAEPVLASEAASKIIFWLSHSWKGLDLGISYFFKKTLCLQFRYWYSYWKVPVQNNFKDNSNWPLLHFKTQLKQDMIKINKINFELYKCYIFVCLIWLPFLRHKIGILKQIQEP